MQRDGNMAFSSLTFLTCTDKANLHAKEKTMRPTFIQSHTTLFYVFTASKEKKTTYNSHGLTNCHGVSYTHDQTSSRRCKGLGHASTTRRQTLNSRLANIIAFWETRNEAGQPETGLGEQRIGSLFRAYVSIELRWGLPPVFLHAFLALLKANYCPHFPFFAWVYRWHQIWMGWP